MSGQAKPTEGMAVLRVGYIKRVHLGRIKLKRSKMKLAIILKIL